MKRYGRQSIYSIEFKIKVIEEYISTNLSQVEIGYKYGIAVQTKAGKSPICNSVSSWYSLYKRGLLKIDNAIAVSHTPTKVIKKEVEPTPIITEKRRELVEYIEPELFYIGDKAYILVEDRADEYLYKQLMKDVGHDK